MKLEQTIPLLEKILLNWKDAMGDNYKPYKNHVYRVVNFCFALSPCTGEDREKVIIAGCFHDLGIWTNHTVNYLLPSVELAKHYLESEDKSQWISEIGPMIDLHHKITHTGKEDQSLIEIFRKADWIDVSFGLRSFGLKRQDIRAVRQTFPNLGFHKGLTKLWWTEFLRHPLHSLPMMKW